MVLEMVCPEAAEAVCALLQNTDTKRRFFLVFLYVHIGLTQQPPPKNRIYPIYWTQAAVYWCHPNNRRAISMAAAERITFADFQERFKTEEQCREYLFRQRFPNAFVCPLLRCEGVLPHLPPEPVPVQEVP